MAKILNFNLNFTGIYRAEIVNDENKVYIPNITNFSLVNGAKDSYMNHINALPTAYFSAPSKKATECEKPAKCWVVFEGGDVSRPIIMGFLGDSIKEAGISNATGSGSGGGSGAAGGSSGSDSGQSSNVATSGGDSNIVNTAKKYLGVPYVWGGETPSGFDCSGFVQYVYKQHGISISRTTYDQVKQGVHVDKNNLQPGDLIFFNNANHVGMYVGDGQFIHAPSTGDVIKISSLSSNYYTQNYYEARRYTKN